MHHKARYGRSRIRVGFGDRSETQQLKGSQSAPKGSPDFFEPVLSSNTIPRSFNPFTYHKCSTFGAHTRHRAAPHGRPPGVLRSAHSARGGELPKGRIRSPCSRPESPHKGSPNCSTWTWTKKLQEARARTIQARADPVCKCAVAPKSGCTHTTSAHDESHTHSTHVWRPYDLTIRFQGGGSIHLL
jgi:hypothetical protein